MVKELFDSTWGLIFPNAEYEHVEDAPGETITVRVTLPFFNLDTDENIIVSTVFDEEKKLFQISDMGFCFSKLEELDRKELRFHKNFVRGNGFIFDYSKENNYFFVLSPVVEYENEKVNMSALIGHYLTIIMSYNQ